MREFDLAFMFTNYHELWSPTLSLGVHKAYPLGDYNFIHQYCSTKNNKTVLSQQDCPPNKVNDQNLHFATVSKLDLLPLEHSDIVM